MDKVEKLYEDLYDITQNNMTKAASSLQFGRSSFSVSSKIEPFVVDLFDFVNLSNKDFLTAVYVFCLERIPDEKALTNHWESMYNIPEREFRAKVIKTIASSPEFCNRDIVIKNNYFDCSDDIEMIRSVDITKKHKIIYKIYKLLPLSVRQVIRKIIKYEAI